MSMSSATDVVTSFACSSCRVYAFLLTVHRLLRGVSTDFIVISLKHSITSQREVYGNVRLYHFRWP